MTKRSLNQETAKQAHDRHLVEIGRRIALLQEAVAKLATKTQAPHWGHVGDLTEIEKNLKGALHWAGCNEFVER